MPRLMAVTTTVATRDQALHIARHLVEQRLAACVQLTPIESVYPWQGVLQQAPEIRLQAKTTEAQLAAVQATILALHPYTLPELHAQVLDPVHAPYAEWVAQATGGDAAGPTHPPG